MDYYASKQELLVWTNKELALQVVRLEQFATGAVFCQLLDAYFPDVVPIFRVNFFAREEYEILLNFKVLQAVLTNLKVTKDLNVPNLVKASTVENLELLQWMYRFLRRKRPQADYDAKQRRSLSVRGGTSDIPVPTCIGASFDVYGRSQADMRNLAGSPSTWNALGLEAPTTGGSPVSGSRNRVARPASTRPTSAGAGRGRVSLSQVTSRYRDGVVTPTASANAGASPAGSDYGGGVLTKQSSFSSMGTQTEAEAAALAGGGPLPSPLMSPLGGGQHRRRSSIDDAADFADAGYGYDSSSGGGLDIGVGTHDAPAGQEGRDGNGWRDARGRTTTTTSGGGSSFGQDDASDAPRMRSMSPGTSAGGSSTLLSSRHTTRSAGGALADAAAAPARSAFASPSRPAVSSPPQPQSAPRSSPGLTAAAAAATGLMEGALATGRRSAALLRHSVPGLRRLGQILAQKAATSAAKASGGGGSDADAHSELIDAAEVAAAARAAGLDNPDSYTFRGKIRSLQDALATLLRHTGLLLADVQAHSASRPRAAAAAEAAAAAASGMPSLAVQAAALMSELHDLEEEFAEIAALASVMDDVTPEEGPPLLLPPPAASSTASQVLSEEQRALSTTTQLDACLKAVGLSQFGLVQGIHKEIAQITALFLQQDDPLAVASSGGAGGDPTTPERDVKAGVGAGKRMARVFRLGDYTLKQLRNGDIYKGRYVGNKKNGAGVYHFVNGDVYEGEFKDDRMDGHGVYTFSHEGRYEGQWHNAVYSGCGTETFAKGSTYHGEYAGGLRNGWGACRFFNGDYYEGQWLKGLRDGRGMQQCTDDSNYVGDYTRGKRHGHGIYSFANGDRYVGNYADDLPDGHGVYYFSSGQRYEGQWHRGRKHGWSMYTVENGSRFVGQWTEGKPQWVQPLPPGVDPQQDFDEADVAGWEGRRAADSAAAGPASTSAALSTDLEPTLRETVAYAFEAYRLAQAAASGAEERAGEHWGPGVNGRAVQKSIREAVGRSTVAAGVAQSCRQSAQDLGSKLDNAVALLRTDQDEAAEAAGSGEAGARDAGGAAAGRGGGSRDAAGGSPTGGSSYGTLLGLGGEEGRDWRVAEGGREGEGDSTGGVAALGAQPGEGELAGAFAGVQLEEEVAAY